MIESKLLRGYKSKVFVKEDKTIHRLFASNVHYNNYKKLGDGGGGLRGISKDWVELDLGFYYEFADDPVTVSKFSDGEIIYQDNFHKRENVVKYTPVCNHVEGFIVGRDLVYNHAFETGVDLILRPKNTSLQKLVRIRDKQSKEYNFKFKIEIPKVVDPNSEVYAWRVSKTDLTDYYKIILDGTEKVFDNPNRITVIGKSPTEGTVIKTPYVWDDETIEAIEVKFTFENGSYHIEKIIPQSFIDNSVGDIYTDTETTISTDTDAERRGNKSGTISDYANLYSSQETSVTDNTTINSMLWNKNATWKSNIYVSYVTFPISSLAGLTVTAVDLTMRVDGKDNTEGSDTNNKIVICKSLYNDAASIPGGRAPCLEGTGWERTLLSTDEQDINGASVDDDFTWSFDATGISELNTSIGNSETEFLLVPIHKYAYAEVYPTLTSTNDRSSMSYYVNGNANEPFIDVTTADVVESDKQIISVI